MELASELQFIEIERIFLDQENPRHSPFKSEDEVIDYLCSNEDILALAKDIVKNGLNPLEKFGLISERENSYLVVEGNRRLCALKLLHDSDRAPNANLRRAFENMSEEWSPILEIPAVLFDSRSEVKLWLERIHAGYAGGRGRRQWNAEQKARHTGYDKNRAAQTVLDLAEQNGLVTRKSRRGRLSTVQRYLSNPIFRNSLGLEISDPKNVTTTLNESDFQVLIQRFMKDVVSKQVHTRDNKDVIETYANTLSSTGGLSGNRYPPRNIDQQGQGKETEVVKPKPPRVSKLHHAEKLGEALERTGNYKLQKLYYSLHTLHLANHTPLLTVGAWVFVETLTALAGRNDNVSFVSFFSNQKLQELGIERGQRRKAILQAIRRLMEHGNTTKHDQSSAAFNEEMFANDWETMEEILIELASSISSRQA